MRTSKKPSSSSLADDCITAMSEGLCSAFYNYFLARLWGDGDSAYLSEADASVDSEWESYSSVIMRMRTNYILTPERRLDSMSRSSWDFLINSKFHRKYCKTNAISGISTRKLPDPQESDSLESYLDGAQALEKSFYSELLMETLDALHAVYESLKLDNLRKQDLGLLVVLLCNIADFLGEESYLDHYIRDFPGLSKKFGMQTSFSGKTPPSLFRWLEHCLQHGADSVDSNDLPPLICKDESSVLSWARKIISFYSLLCGAKQSGKNLSSGVRCNIATGSSCNCEQLTVLAMVGERFALQQLDLLPCGVSLPLRHVLDKCRESPPTDWPAAAYVLLGRGDLALSCLSHSSNYKKIPTPKQCEFSFHVHTILLMDLQADGMEHVFNSTTQLRYGRDLRLNEVRRLLCSARSVAIQTSVNPTTSDQDLQQAQLWQLAQRTTALPLGRGAFTLATTSTLLTEVNLDPNIRNIPELKSWPEFHNAVAAGLKLAPLQGKMSRTWIVYNKPEEPNAIHAGLLLALGLHGHLGVLTITDIYQYYSQSLYVHIPAHHPSSFPELELPTLLQERFFPLTVSTDDHNRVAGQSESDLVVSRLSIPCTRFNLQYVRPDFIMLRVIAQNLIMWSRVHPSKDWIQSQIPEIVQNGINGLGDEMGDVDEMDAEAFVQAYVNIVVGSCISIGLRFAGTKNEDARDLLYDYAVYFLNEVSLAVGFLFLGGGMRTFSTSNSSIAVLLISLYPRLPTGPNDNRCHLQAFRHLYVLATEARWIQTVDVDTGLPVYAPLEVTVKETEHYAETSFCEVTPCILPERALLKTVRVCGPRYWPQVIELVPEENPWWITGDRNDPFNSGVLYIKRKVGACSYVDDPVGCQSLLSQAMHKVFGLTSLRACTPSTNDCGGAGAVTIDQLVYLSLYTMLGFVEDQVTSGASTLTDSLSLSLV
ncbi:E3 ubiquitin ligase [Actinidia rufa]|uniref:E3 ubiquitin ligase n=1 Tax=Actinidia rufa TaxID=165716 RepID=A0A7J0E6Y7_9ERIC|nr:E3 ubiquitin ligase [Actinidia rufa]